jgi:hypothetical protein
MRPVRLVPVLAVAVASLLAAGCGSGSSSTNDKVPTTKGPVIPAKLTVPDEDSRITKGLGDSADVLSAAGCSFGTLPEQDKSMTNYHVSPDQLEWKTNPPSSGRHLPDWMPWGIYDTQVPDGNAVHNLEHGGVIAWIGTKVDDAQRKAIDALPKRGQKWLVSPRKQLDGLYSVAWTQGLDCPPAALAKLSTKQLTSALDAWYDVASSQGSPGEKDIPAVAGGVSDPAPVRDISAKSPF